MEQQIVKIPVLILNALLNKVAERPFNEVAQLIQQTHEGIAKCNQQETPT